MELTFYFDLGSPYAYLTAERLPGLTDAPVRWQPVLLGGLFAANGRSSWARAGEESRAGGIAEVERRASAYGLPAIVWPDPWPGSYLTAMRAATYAFGAGAGERFVLHAFRDAFQRGSDLAELENVLDAAEVAGLDRTAVRDAIADPQVKLALREATDAAHALGVIGVPTLAVGDELFWGDDRAEEAVARCSS